MFHKSLLVLTLLVPFAVFADHDEDDDDDDDDERPGLRLSRATPEWKRYEAECGSCHLAYPPSMLPARSWAALLSGLDDHFGQNAELDAATRSQLGKWLAQNGGRDVPGPTPLRITELRWWRHEHDEVPASTYRRKAILTPSNCGACHPGAKDGAFGEHAVKVPRDAPAPR